MVLKHCERLIAIAKADFPADMQADILVPALGMEDPGNYWQRATAFLALAIARHQVSQGELRAGHLWMTLTTLTADNVLSNLGGEDRDYYGRMEPGHLVALVGCVHAFLRKNFPIAA